MDTCPNCSRTVIFVTRTCPGCRQELTDAQVATIGLDFPERSDSNRPGKELKSNLAAKETGRPDEVASAPGKSAGKRVFGLLLILGWIVGRISNIETARGVYGDGSERLTDYALKSTLSPLLIVPIVGLLLILASFRKQ